MVVLRIFLITKRKKSVYKGLKWRQLGYVLNIHCAIDVNGNKFLSIDVIRAHSKARDLKFILAKLLSEWLYSFYLAVEKQI